MLHVRRYVIPGVWRAGRCGRTDKQAAYTTPRQCWRVSRQFLLVFHICPQPVFALLSITQLVAHTLVFIHLSMHISNYSSIFF